MVKFNIFSAQHFKFGTDLWDPSHRFETSWLLPPWILFAIRAAIVRPFPSSDTIHTRQIGNMLMDIQVTVRVHSNLLHHRLGTQWT